MLFTTKKNYLLNLLLVKLDTFHDVKIVCFQNRFIRSKYQRDNNFVIYFKLQRSFI